jgi:glycosyltransferase involved in cell wall biosynthesis
LQVIPKRKLLFIVNVDWFFISHRLPIALSAIQNGYEVHIACAITNRKEELSLLGLIVHPLGLSRSGIGVIGELKSLLQVYRLLVEVKPDILHTVTIKPVLYGNILARLTKVPVRVSSISGLGYVFVASGLKSKFFRSFIAVLYRIALNGVSSVIFQNKADRDVLSQMRAIKPFQEVFIRGSGVELNKYAVMPEPSGKPVVMLISRLLIDKGVGEFVAASKLLKNERNDIRMVLVGEIDPGNPSTITNEQLTSWVDCGLVEHWGYSSSVSEVIAKSNIIVLPSYREGLPKCLIEAAACGRAVITTDVPGCRDAIEPGKTGLLVAPKSDKALARAITRLVDDKLLRYSFAIRSRFFAEEAFDIKDVIEVHLSLYDKD